MWLELKILEFGIQILKILNVYTYSSFFHSLKNKYKKNNKQFTKYLLYGQYRTRNVSWEIWVLAWIF